MTDSAQQTDPPLEVDCPCVACEYNLRGLSERGLCPECGTAVESSVAAMKAGGVTAAEAKQARFVAMVLIVAIGVSAVSGIRYASPSAWSILQGGGQLLGWVALLAAVWRLPGGLRFGLRRRLAVRMTIAALAAPVGLALLTTLTPSATLWYVWWLGLVGPLMSVAATVAIAMALSPVARAGRRPRLARAIEWMGVSNGVAVCSCLWALGLYGRFGDPLETFLSQPPPVLGYAWSIGAVMVSFEPRYFAIPQFWAWLTVPVAAGLTFGTLFVFRRAMRKRETIA